MLSMTAFENALVQLERAAKYAKVRPFIIERLRHPNRIVEASLPVAMDSGEERILTAYRVQHNNARGPYKGGIRFHPKVSKDEVQALGLWMAIKCAVANIPLGGGKGGVIVDSKQLSKAELERLSRGFVRAFKDILGPQLDVPAPDVYTTPEIMDWMADEYVKLTGDQKGRATFTGKPLEKGGSEGRGTATAQGGLYVLDAYAKAIGLDPNATITIQGFGNAGRTFAELASQVGYTIIAVSDSSGGLYNPQGLDVSAVESYKDEHRSLGGYPDAQSITNEDLLGCEADILVPAALEGQITGQNQYNVKARVILELANGPTTPEADIELLKRKIDVIPDVLANSGGVTVSYFEWEQNNKGEHWTAGDVDTKLKTMMADAFQTIHDRAKKDSIDMRTAAFAIALERIAEAT
ncbi:MAG: Glu/Leu/Phe/Val dehydrogenase [Candidatus Komeilibacteria bacterium]|nr:Glu/Leu/Phe/Val dehydrogenase [Candidatus Komeilibacteria bacterium]